MDGTILILLSQSQSFGDFSNSESWDESQHSKFWSAATRRRFRILQIWRAYGIPCGHKNFHLRN